MLIISEHADTVEPAAANSFSLSLIIEFLKIKIDNKIIALITIKIKFFVALALFDSSVKG